MNGAHDVGGMQTFGPVDPHDDGRAFHAGWEGRTFAISLILPAQGVYNLDEFRDRRERIPPPAFLAKPYFDLWLTSVEALAVEKGLVTREELERRAAELRGAAPPEPARTGPDELAGRLLRSVFHGEPARRDGPAPRFSPGDRVRARDLHPGGHIRMPRYVRGRTGTVVLGHGCFVLPDASAEGRVVPEPLYTVRFEARDLWGPQAREGDGVRVDLWESYLEPGEG
ncbi:MAG: nitrile hydratase subunit beta [Candidatus Dormibacteraeota bacterium]|nr:nitrile hydratase subunit beta [Candidatus Dormibacteraeota bacterium]MBO0761447.1 nitrile hydratase subunit beta [Candidatus Dormibacteraeota bacterium]